MQRVTASGRRGWHTNTVQNPPKPFGDAHEWGSPDALDSWIDQHNNRVARQIGANAGSPDEIPDLIQAALEDGRLITSPNDARIPEELRGSAL